MNDDDMLFDDDALIDDGDINLESITATPGRKQKVAPVSDDSEQPSEEDSLEDLAAQEDPDLFEDDIAELMDREGYWEN